VHLTEGQNSGLPNFNIFAQQFKKFMNTDEIKNLEKQYRDATAEEIIRFSIDTFGNSLMFATSLAYEDQVVTSLISKIPNTVEFFTLDTGRLFQETYDTIEATNKHFGINITVVMPDRKETEKMVREKGINLFYHSVENRKTCCNIRKTKPLQRMLAGKKAWITGLRREQSITRFGLKKIEFDEINGLVKINPLADWSEHDVIHYIRQHAIPVNPLQEKGYRSIGCMPCTRPVLPDDDVRAGRWWWEQPEHKECGLHKAFVKK
jgi:phosphoadenosine phosphosulfate reductase